VRLENTVPKDSLSLVLPVRNAERSLTDRVEKLLDLLPDLTNRFEILIVDDGSSDSTADVAGELARHYPQLRLIRHDRPNGLDAAARAGLQAASGATVLVQEDSAPLSPTNLRRLWSLRHDDRLLMARTQQRPGILDPDLLERLSTWGQALRELARKNAPGGVQLIRRDAAIRDQTPHVLAAHNSSAHAPAGHHRLS
jgi:glycosyltransferase involved in cell wall biosynthesis